MDKKSKLRAILECLSMDQLICLSENKAALRKIAEAFEMSVADVLRLVFEVVNEKVEQMRKESKEQLDVEDKADTTPSGTPGSGRTSTSRRRSSLGKH